MARLGQFARDEGPSQQTGNTPAVASRWATLKEPALVALFTALLVGAVAFTFDLPRAGTGGGDLQIAGLEVSANPTELNVAAELTSGVPRLTRAWIYLDSPDAPQPWVTNEFRSAIVERQLRAGEPVVVRWQEPLVVRDGVYEASLWVEAFDGIAWLLVRTVKLEGDGLPLRVEQGNAVARIAEGGGPGTVSAIVSTQVADFFDVVVGWDLREDVTEAVFSWELRATGSVEGAAFSSRPYVVGDSGETSIAFDMVLPEGSYDLWIRLRPTAVGPSTLLTYEGAYSSAGGAPFTRPAEPSGEGLWQLQGSIGELQTSTSAVLPMRFEPIQPGLCAAYWVLRIGHTALAQGGGGSCEEPAVFLPDVPPGAYVLEVGAYRPGPNGVSRQMDLVVFEITVVGA